ncbi:hypothetical protein ACWCQL_32380 [Streptomyces sp. NPDC002073]
MDLLGDEFVTAKRVFLSLVACAGLAVAVTGCTDNDTASSPPPAKTPKASAAPSASAGQAGDARLEQSARTALGVSDVPTDDPLFVAMGLERISDGVYADTPLEKGATYRLQVVCVEGKGTVTATATGLPKFSLPCEGGATIKRITSAPASFTLTIKAAGSAPDTAGMIGWRMTRLQ